jgi:hypothetical protein
VYLSQAFPQLQPTCCSHQILSRYDRPGNSALGVLTSLSFPGVAIPRLLSQSDGKVRKRNARTIVLQTVETRRNWVQSRPKFGYETPERRVCPYSRPFSFIAGVQGREWSSIWDSNDGQHGCRYADAKHADAQSTACLTSITSQVSIFGNLTRSVLRGKIVINCTKVRASGMSEIGGLEGLEGTWRRVENRESAPQNEHSIVGRREQQPNAFSEVDARKDRHSTDMTRRSRFVVVWETTILPDLENLMEEVAGDEHVILVFEGNKASDRVVQIMTPKELDGEVRQRIVDLVRTRTPQDLATTMTLDVEFAIGSVEHCRAGDDSQDGGDPEGQEVHERAMTSNSTASDSVSQTPTLEPFSDRPDPVCRARNYHIHPQPVSGDSIASMLGSQGGSGTLGPALMMKGERYWLTTFHQFDDDERIRGWTNETPEPIGLVHPSPEDWDTCARENPDAVVSSLEIGRLVAYSGKMYRSTRESKSVLRGLEEHGVRLPPSRAVAVTDWALSSAIHNVSAPNTMRQVNEKGEVGPTIGNITDTLETGLGRRQVYSTGRTSGLQEGQICEIPGSLWGKQNGAGRRTREWYIAKNVDIKAPIPAWKIGGMGVPGDSGAPVVDKESNKLVGMIWGRNWYNDHVTTRRVAYFTAMTDIFDDILERYPNIGMPVLPAEEASSVARRRIWSSAIQSIDQPAVIGTSSSVQRSTTPLRASDKEANASQKTSG